MIREKQMTGMFLALFTSLLLFQVTDAQTLPARAVSSNTFQDSQQREEPDEARELNRKVVELYRAGKLDEALALAKRVLEIREKATGKDSLSVVEALINLAEIYQARKSYKEALVFYERVLKINERLAGTEDASNTLLLDKIAFLRYMNKDFSGAENYYTRSLAISEAVSGPQSEPAAQSAYRLAEFYRFTNSYQKAYALYHRALSVLEKSLGPENPKLLGILESYACFLGRMNRDDESRAAWTRAGKIRAGVINERLKSRSAQAAAAGEQFSTAQPISKPQPIYPEEARRGRLIGVVTVQVIIDGTGKVIRACASGADPVLLEAAEQAALRARFRPLIIEGIPTETTSVIVYNFTLR